MIDCAFMDWGRAVRILITYLWRYLVRYAIILIMMYNDTSSAVLEVPCNT